MRALVAAQLLERLFHPVGAVRHRIGNVQRLRAERVVLHAADGADLLEVFVREDGLAHFEALALAAAGEVEHVRPRADERD